MRSTSRKRRSGQAGRETAPSARRSTAMSMAGKEAESTAIANEIAFSRVLFSPKIGPESPGQKFTTTVLGTANQHAGDYCADGFHSHRACGTARWA